MTSSHNLESYDSYPPFFRPDNIVDNVDLLSEPEPKPELDSNPLPDLESGSDSIPIIDLEEMNPENLGQVCRDWGMFRLTNHGVPSELLSQLEDEATRLFSELSFESKQDSITSPIGYFWGSPALTTSGDVAVQRGPYNLNWLEGLNVPLVEISQFRYEDASLESFRSLLQEYGHHQTRLANTIFGTMAKDLNFPPKKSNSYLSESTGFLRVYRYLRCPMADRNWGIYAHTDSSVLSIIHQDQVGALQVFKNNKWIDIEPIRDTLIVNIGDMMQAMSNDDYVSALHRVKVKTEKERISIGYFVFPAEDGVIESSNYKPFTYADFQAKKDLDLKTVGVKVGLPRFRISENNELS